MSKKTKIQKIVKWMRPYVASSIGIYYGVFHIIIMLCSATVLLFDNNPIHLIIMFNLLSMDAVSCVILKNCPLTILEHKYLGRTCISTKIEFLQWLGIDHHCNHEYETTLETLINVGCFFILKISILFLLKLFPIQLSVNNDILKQFI
jgi:hypothetical protein